MKKLIVLYLLFICCGCYSAQAQRVIIPGDINFPETDHAKLQKYCNNLSKIERLLLLTVDSVIDEGGFEYALRNIQSYHDNTIEEYNKEFNILDTKNGYLRIGHTFGGVAITYWNIKPGKQLVAINRQTELCCDALDFHEPRFFIFENDTLTYIAPDQVFDSPVKWYDVFTLETYIDADNQGYGIGWGYMLPTKGKDIEIVGVGGCGSAWIDKEVTYKWNGDGTFTKTPNIAKEIENNNKE